MDVLVRDVLPVSLCAIVGRWLFVEGVTGLVVDERKAGWIALFGVTGDCTISVASGVRSDSDDTMARKAGYFDAFLNILELDGSGCTFFTGVGELSITESFRGKGRGGRGPVGMPILACLNSRAASMVWLNVDPRFGTYRS